MLRIVKKRRNASDKVVGMSIRVLCLTLIEEGEEESVGKLPDWKGSKGWRLMGLREKYFQGILPTLKKTYSLQYEN